ncbi:MAG TPA: hypothetical protein VIX17_11370 [Pyrinomonadaceae bacterium]|jgi:hypothetical protein
MQELTWKVSIDPAIATAALKEITNEVKTATADVEASVRREAQAAIALQRQRSAAFYDQWKKDAKEAEKAEREKQAAIARVAAQSAASNLQLAGHTREASGIVESAIDELSEHLNVFVGERLPLVGGGFVRITDNLRSLYVDLQPTEGSVLRLGQAIFDLTSKSNKSADEIKGFLESYAKLESQSEKDAAAIEFFGADLAQKLSPALNRASTEITALAEGGEAAGASIAAVAVPVAIAVAAILALAAAEYELIQRSYEASLAFAEQGEKLGRAADQTKLSVEQLEALQIAGGRANITLEEIALTLGRYLSAVGRAQREGSTSQLAHDFEDLGIDITKLGDDPVKAIDELFKAFDRLGPSVKENTAATDLLSRSGIRMISLFRETGGSVNDLVEKTKSLRVYTDQYVEQAKQENAALSDLSKAWSNLTFQLGESVSPDVTAFLNELTAAIRDDGEAIKFLFNAASWLITGATISEWFKNLKGAVKLVNDLTDAWNRAAAATRAYIDVGGGAAGVGAAAAAASAPPPQTTTPPSAGTSAAVDQVVRQAPASVVTSAQLQGLKTLAEQVAAATQESIAKTDAALKLGTTNQKVATDQIIEALKRQRDAKVDYLNAEIAQHQKEQQLAQDQGNFRLAQEEQTKIDTLQGQALQTREKFDEEALQRRTALRERDRNLEIQHYESLTRINIEGQQRNIEAAQRAYERGDIDRATANKKIEEAESASLTAQKHLLAQKIEVYGKESDAARTLAAEIKELEEKQTSQQQEQADRRKEIALEETRRKAEIEDDAARSRLNVQRIQADARIALVRNEAEQGRLLYEAAAKQITLIQLTQLDREIELEKSRKQNLAKLYPKQDDRVKAEAELNNRIAELQAERTALLKAGDIEAAKERERDIQNLNAYAEELIRIYQQIRRAEIESNQLAIEILILQHARSKQILAARRELEVNEEKARHARIIDSIRAQRIENAESKRTTEEKLRVQEQLDHLEEEEYKRHQLELQKIDQETQNDKKRTGALGGFFGGLDSGQLAELTDGIKSFEDVAVVAFSAVGAAINGLANGVGNLVQNWVLMGSQADINTRKLVATVLAGVAAQSAVLAVFELAKGFASLFFNPAEAVAHFKAAALFGLLAVGTGLAGRAIAGNAFQQASGTGTSTGTSRSNAPSTNSTNPQTTDVNRRNAQPPITVNILGVPSEEYKYKVVGVVVGDYKQGGKVRDMLGHHSREPGFAI